MSFPLFKREAGALVPANDEAKEALASVPDGAFVTVEIKRPRNLKQLRLYWQLCSYVGESIGYQREVCSDIIKLKTGHVTTVMSNSGVYQLPKSIAAASLKQDRFNAFFNRACMVLCQEFIPHMQPGELRRQIEQMVGIPQSQTEAA